MQKRVGLTLLAGALLAGCSYTSPSKSSDSYLSLLTVSVGTLAPAFYPTVFHYDVSVPFSIESVTFTATVSSSKASFLVMGVAVTPGMPSAPQPLVHGPNTVIVTVFAEDGSRSDYTVIVTRS